MTTTDAPDTRFDIFYKHDDLTRLLFEYAQAFPTLAAIRSIGKSYEGRDIWVATITNIATGAAEDKPAFWADGNIHAAELTASTAVLYFLNELLTKLRQRRRDHAAARHARDLPLPAPEPRRRRARARRPAAPHPLVDAAAIRSTRSRSTASPPRTSTATAGSSSCASPIRTARGRSASRIRA